MEGEPELINFLMNNLRDISKRGRLTLILASVRADIAVVHGSIARRSPHDSAICSNVLVFHQERKTSDTYPSLKSSPGGVDGFNRFFPFVQS